MGASKEGVMSVREKINSVLYTFYLEEEDEEPPDAGGGEEEENVPRTGGGTPSGEGVAVVSKESVVGGTSREGNCSSDLIKRKLFLNELASSWGSGGSGSSQQLVNSGVGRGRTSGDSGGGGGDNVIMDTSIGASGGPSSSLRRGDDKLSGDKKKSGMEVFRGVEEDKDNNLVILKDLLESQMRLVRVLEKRLNKSESKLEAEVVEREKVQKTLEDERMQHQLLKEETRATINMKDYRIRELERQLAIVSAKKPTDDKATCVTPPPPPPPPTPPRENLSNARRPAENDMDAPPPYKRAKLDLGHYDTPSKHFLPPPPYQKSSFQSSPSSSSSYLSPRTPQHYRHQRRSDSPPHLSPAVTPKSAHQNTSGRPKEMRYHLGQEVNDDDDGLLGGPPDEFHDELERIIRETMPSHKQVKIRSNSNHLSHPPPSYSQHQHHQAQQSSSSNLPTSSSGPSGFVRPSPSTKPRHTRFMFPEGKRRFMNNSSSSVSSFFQPVKSKFQSNQFYSSDGTLPKSNHHPHSLLASSSKHTVIRNRSNNFLNLNRPLAKKAPVVVVPLPSSQNTPSSSHFRSLDAASAAQSSSSREQREEEQAALVPSITPPVIQKKRKVGRPPGSGLKSKLVPRSSFSSTFSSPSSGSGTPLQNSGGPQLPNGSIGLQEQPAAPPPPQRFSQRGRLLKPNRARYSPDPDVSPSPVVNVTPREKYLTTKRSYFVGEPFVQQGYPGEEVDHLHREDTVGSQITPSATPTLESEMGSGEAACLQTPSENLTMSKSPLESFEDGSESGVGSSLLFVEVPKWRVNVLEGYSDFEDRENPDDDMSEEAFHRRHHKLEAKEKQRKRWDSQRMREESYLERLKRKQEERERQKELRRQQRKRNKGIKGASEEESITPNSDEIKAIHIGTELPVGAFGHPLPLVEKVDFMLPWNLIASVIAKKTASTSTPPPVVEINEENSSGAAAAVVTEKSESEKSKDASAPEVESMELSSVVAPSPPLVRLTSSSPSSSSISLPSIPSPGRSPPPPAIYPDGSSDEVDSQATTVPESLDTDDDSLMIIDEDERLNGVESSEENGDNLEEDIEECAPSSPVFSVDLVDYVNSDQSGDDPTDHFDGDGGENCDISNPVSATPSISIPLQSPSESKSTSPSLDQLNNSTVDSSSSASNRVKDLRPRNNNNSTVVHFPMSFSTSGATSSTSTISPHSSSSSSQVSKTSITFFIPNNPLAPSRNLRRPPSTTVTPSIKPSSSSSSIATPASGPSSDSRQDS